LIPEVQARVDFTEPYPISPLFFGLILTEIYKGTDIDLMQRN